MFKGKTIFIASLSLALLLTSSALGQDKGKPAATRRKAVAGKNKGKQARYANQEVSYRKKSTSFDKGYLPPAAANQTSNQLLPYIEQSNLKKPQPNQQGILPYIEHSNVRSRNAQKRR
jgi:hypothetical protein